MSTVPQTNVVGTFPDATSAEAAVVGLKEGGFVEDRIGVLEQGERRVVTVAADGRHGEAAACLSEAGASGVQNVAR